jgi:alpha-2-macroglobulin
MRNSWSFRHATLVAVSLAIVLALSLGACSGKQETALTPPADISGVISSYTTGIIGSESEIAVRFTEPVPERIWQQNQPVFSFSPSIPGRQVWADNRTVVFRPEKRLENGKRFAVEFDIRRILPEIDFAGKMEFAFEVITQDIDVVIDPLSPDPEQPDGLRQVLTGRIVTADVATMDDIRKVLTVRVQGQLREPRWTRESRTEYLFTVDRIQREVQPTSLMVSWNGAPIGSATRGQQQVMIPSTGEFKLTNINVRRAATPTIDLIFSDLLDESQNLRGLITIEGQAEPGFVIRNNTIIVHPRNIAPGPYTMVVATAIRNRDGKRLEEEVRREITIGSHNPEIRLIGSGTILSRNTELLFPFEAVNLGAVDVQVTRIFENNVAQFLQQNTLSGSYMMQQVGRPVVQQVVPLHTIGEVRQDRWSSYALDLSAIMTPEPGAIYSITIGFRQHQSLYPCEDVPDAASGGAGSAAGNVAGSGGPGVGASGATGAGAASLAGDAGRGGSGGLGSAPAQTRSWIQDEQTERDYWRNFEYFWMHGDYSWNDRNNPCRPSYYTSDRRISRNAFASELGLIAKRSVTGDLYVAVTDLTTTSPLSGIHLDVLDYQQQPMSTGVTDSDGKWSARNLPRDPYLLLASRGNERGYLRLDDNTSLNMSDFDVSGARITDGIKGFIYAERDVWRPGDSLFVHLIVEASEQHFPKTHPVTFELVDPSGNVVHRRSVQGTDRIYAFPTRTPRDARTGRWMVRARVGGVTFSRNLNIETIMPNRLKIDLNLDSEEIRGRRADLSGEIRAEWLHGAIAGRLQTDVQVSLRQGQLTFSAYPGYSFANPLISIETPQTEIFKGRLDAEGKVRFSHTFARSEATTPLIIGTLQTRVFEESGAFSTSRSQFRHLPYEQMVGVRLPGMDPRWSVVDRESAIAVEAVVVDADGNPLRSRELTMSLFELDWRWWWQRGNENLSQFYAGRNLQSILTVPVQTGADGRVRIEVPADRLDWGRYLLRVSLPDNGHSSGVVFYAGWSGREDGTTSPQRLALNLDKEQYTTGEQVTLQFPGSRQGRALVSLENGTDVVQSFWVETTAGVNKVTFQATDAMSPNVYATVHVIQPNSQRDNDLPVRMYGSVPVLVESPSTRLQPVIGLPAEMRPESQAQITISEATGKAMTYTIAIVDEGLLDITNFRTPQPHDHFYAREALGVRTWDMYNEVAGSYAGTIGRILAIGGDMELETPDADTDISRFRPMVRVLGPFTLAAGRTVTHTVQVPNYVGSVRTMVIAARYGAYGNAEARTPVRQPVMVLGTLPRVLSPGESLNLPVSVFAMRDDIRSVGVTVQANAMFTMTGGAGAGATGSDAGTGAGSGSATGSGAGTTGTTSPGTPGTATAAASGATSARQTATFTAPGSQTLRFPMEVAGRVGAGAVSIRAESGSERASDDINIEIRNPAPPVTRLYEKALAPGESWAVDMDPVGLAGTNEAMLEISGIPPIDLGRRLRFLNLYPHSNLEFRISATFPYLYYDRFTRLEEHQKAEVEHRVQLLIAAMEPFRTANGGMSYWPGSRWTNDWVTSYALHFLLEAEQAGYFVPASLKQGLLQYQRNAATNWRQFAGPGNRNDIQQAYRLYTLALSGDPAMGPMNRMRESANLSLQARWRLAAAYVVAGNPEAADALTSTATTRLDDYMDLWDCFCSTERDRAMILDALSLMGRQHMAVPLMQQVSRSLSSDDWMSTQAVAFSVIAAARFVAGSPVSEQMDVAFRVSSLGDGAVQGAQPLAQVPVPVEGTDVVSVRVENRGQGTVFARLSQTGVPMMDTLEPASNGLALSVRYIYPNGDAVDPARLRQGTDIIAEATVLNNANRGVYHQIALHQAFPSGWEISTNRLDGITFGAPGGQHEHQDIRDDRVITYMDLSPGVARTFQVRLTATYEGRFYLPAVRAYALYDSRINALVPGRWVEVVRD